MKNKQLLKLAFIKCASVAHGFTRKYNLPIIGRLKNWDVIDASKSNLDDILQTFSEQDRAGYLDYLHINKFPHAIFTKANVGTPSGYTLDLPLSEQLRNYFSDKIKFLAERHRLGKNPDAEFLAGQWINRKNSPDEGQIPFFQDFKRKTNGDVIGNTDYFVQIPFKTKDTIPFAELEHDSSSLGALFKGGIQRRWRNNMPDNSGQWYSPDLLNVVSDYTGNSGGHVLPLQGTGGFKLFKELVNKKITSNDTWGWNEKALEKLKPIFSL
jgi:hypothetical protein